MPSSPFGRHVVSIVVVSVFLVHYMSLVTKEFSRQPFEEISHSKKMKRASTLEKERNSHDFSKPADTRGGVQVPSWCDASTVEEWMPTGDDEWQVRSPAFMLIGTKKGGTTALNAYLLQHPAVVAARTKELKFFRANPSRYTNSAGTVNVAVARRLMRKDYKTVQLQKHADYVSFDATPYYLFFSAHIPRQILCTCPWLKIMAVLRDPVSRVWSNYLYNIVAGVGSGSLEDMIDADFEKLRKAGVIPRSDDMATMPNRTLQEEERVWKKYTEMAGINGIVGRSIYVFQVEPWLRALKEIGRDPKAAALMIQTEDMDRNRPEVFRRVIDFLGLESHELKENSSKRNTHLDFVTSQKNRIMEGEGRREGENSAALTARLQMLKRMESGKEVPRMKDETRERLKKFFVPYNQRLYDLLGDGWQGAWEKPKST